MSEKNEFVAAVEADVAIEVEQPKRVLHVACSFCQASMPLKDWEAHAARCGYRGEDV